MEDRLDLRVPDTVARYKAFDPHWTEREYPRGGSRDDLGIETLSESILAELLPGINNGTSRARYYSFWAWALRDFIHDETATHTQSGFYEWARSRENALILASLAHGCNATPAGTTQGIPRWNEGSHAAYPLDWKPLLSVEGGSYQLYYRGVLQEMNIMRFTEGSPHDDLTRTIGVGLADAYAETVADTRYVQQYLQATRLRKEDIVDFAHSGCLCHVGHNETERRRLIDAFFRFDTPDLNAVRRLGSLCLFLDIIDQSDGQPLDRDAMRAALYFWSYGDHHGYEPEGNLLSPAKNWRVFQLRQYQVYAIESFWSLFLDRIQIETLTGGEYLVQLREEFDLSALASDYDLALPTTDVRSLTFSAFLEAVRDALPEGALLSGVSACTTALNEHVLYRRIWAERTHLTAQSGCGLPLLMLALIYWRYLPWQNQPGWTFASDRFGAGRLPLESHVRDVERAIEEEWSLARWLGWVHHHYIWLQHRRVALEKLVGRGQEVAQFEVVHEEGLGEPRYRGLGRDEPKMNAPRFPNALSILLDLRVIEAVGDGYCLLPDGEALLAQFRDYTIPETTDSDEDEATDSPDETDS